MPLTKEEKYQKRLMLILLTFVLMLLLAWTAAFKKTWTVYRQVRQMKGSIQSAGTVVKKDQLQLEINQLNSLLGMGDANIKRNLVFEELVNLCRSVGNVRLINYPDIHQMNINNYVVNTSRVELEGSYSNLLKLVHLLEKNSKTGKLISIDFKKSKDLKKDIEYLSLIVVLQTYEPL